MLGVNPGAQCIVPLVDESFKERYTRCVFEDMKIAIDCLKSLDDKLKTLHPDVLYKIRSLI